MRTEQLFYLCEVSKIGSINSAAEKLHISQQSLNTTLKNLEKELGYSLFKTSHRGIVLTPQGEIVVQTAEAVLPLLDQMTLALKQSSSEQTKHPESISIAAPSVVLEMLLPNIFQTIYNKYPHISVNLLEKDQLSILNALSQGEIDMAIMGIAYTLWDKLSLREKIPYNLSFVPLYQYKLSVIASENHPAAHYKSLSIKTLLKYPLAIRTNGDYKEETIYHWLQLYGEPQIKFSTPSTSLYKDIIKSSKAVGFYPTVRHCGLNLPIDPGLKLIPLRDDGDATNTVGYVYNNDRPITPIMQTIIDELITFCH